MDPLDLFKKNLNLTPRGDVYARQLDKAAQMIGWKQKYHTPGDGKGVIRRGVGASIHTWAGRPHDSTCRVDIEPDGSVSANIGTQDLGVGCRTVVGAVLAETVGLPLERSEGQHGRQQPAAVGRLGRLDDGGRRFGLDAPRRG
jgi:xanthine dehydrogenase YagR molybdenum-binding subunit